MKNKKINILRCIFAIAIIAASVLVFTGCEDSEIYGLISGLVDASTKDGEANIYSFEADILCDIDVELLKDAGVAYYFDESLDVIPQEIELSIKGIASIEPFEVAAEVVISGCEDTPANIYIQDGELFLELNETSRIAADVLFSMGFVEPTRMAMFNGKIEHDDNTVLCFDVSEFDFEFFKDYIEYANEFIKVESSVKYGEGENVDVPERDESRTIHFEDIKREIEKELLAFDGYRYEQLLCVLSTKDGVNYIDIVGINESGMIVQFDSVSIDSDLDEVRKNPEALFEAEILPLRYIFELLGKRVEWDEKEKTASVSDSEHEFISDKKFIDGRMYTDISRIVEFGYTVEVKDIGDYIEFSIFLDDIYE